MNILMQFASDALRAIALFGTARTRIFSRRMVLFCWENTGKQYLFNMQFNTTQKSMVD